MTDRRDVQQGGGASGISYAVCRGHDQTRDFWDVRRQGWYRDYRLVAPLATRGDAVTAREDAGRHAPFQSCYVVELRIVGQRRSPVVRRLGQKRAYTRRAKQEQEQP